MIGVVLDTIWGSAQSPRWFRINPLNHSGRRLYRLMAGRPFLVTNSCSQGVRSAREHATPDPAWLRSNLRLGVAHGVNLVLVMGSVAGKTFQADMVPPEVRVIHTKHPAARSWTRLELEQLAKEIAQ